MDAALLREREAFKKRAIATPSVENRKKKDTAEPPKKKPKNAGSATSNSTKPKHSSGKGKHL